MKKKNKYNVNNSKKGKADRTVDGHLFMSKKESLRYRELKKLEESEKIKNLELQPKFVLQIKFVDAMGNNHREIGYVADFKYFDKKLKQIVVEDVKGMKTDIYKIKKKLLLYSYQDFIFMET